MDNTAGITFHDVSRHISINGDQALIKRTQHVDDSLLSDIADSRLHASHAPMGDFHYVGSIPVVLVEQWMKEGFNIYDPNVKIQEILKRLKAMDGERLIATNKQI